MVHGGAVNSKNGFFTERDQREVQGISGADFGTSELICPINMIINGFHFPYPLNGTDKPGGSY